MINFTAQREALPEVQREVDSLNKQLKELAKEIWKKGYKLQVITSDGVLSVTPMSLQNVHTCVGFRKRKH